LQYADHHFHKDLYFIFQVFGAIQKCQVCWSASLQINKTAFQTHAHDFMKLTPANFQKASAEKT
jgi:hypothetical protein